MHHHINSIQVHAVQQVRLEQFQALVHQRCGVGRDHSAHVPGRVCQGLIRSDIAHLFAAESPEGPAACGENEPIDLCRGATAKALRQRRVFGVDGNNLTWTCGFGDQRAADHQRLFVGQGKDPPSSQCGQRCCKPGGARDPIEDDVTRHRRQLRGRIRARQDARQRELSLRPATSACLGVKSQLEILHGCRPADRNGPRTAVQRLLRQQRNLLAPSGKAYHLELITMLGDDLQSLGTDRAGTAQDHHVTHGA